MAPLAITASTVVSAIGHGVEATFASLRDRVGALVPCSFADVRIGHVGRVAGLETHALPHSLQRFECRNNRLADMALRTDGFLDRVAEARDRLGAARIAVVLGTSTSGVMAAEDAYRARDPDTGALPASFDYAHTQDLSSLAGYVSAVLGLRGPALVVSTACASSARCFLDAQHLIEAGVCDAAVVGGVDTLCRMTLHGFAALDLISPTPCRPCDAERSGISIGEAAGFALLERDVTPGRMVLLGCGASSDGYHISSPHPEGAGAIAAMTEALHRAGVDPADVDYVNLHGTGTRANDAMEDAAIATVFGPRVPVSSTKGFSGHTLGACGILEAVIAGLALSRGFVPGCLGVKRVDPTFQADVATDNRPATPRHVVSNSFGFGGINCSLVFGTA